MEIIVAVRLYIGVSTGNTCVSHDSGTASGLALCNGAFIRMREGVIAAELVTHFMREIVDNKRIAHGCGMGSKCASLLTCLAHTTNTSRITIIGCAMNKMTDIVIGIADHIVNSGLCSAVEIICPWIGACVQVDDRIVVCDKYHPYSEVALIYTIRAYHRCVHSGQHFCFALCIRGFGAIEEIRGVFPGSGQCEAVCAQTCIIRIFQRFLLNGLLCGLQSGILGETLK